jgi:hypothetical protein
MAMPTAANRSWATSLILATCFLAVYVVLYVLFRCTGYIGESGRFAIHTTATASAGASTAIVSEQITAAPQVAFLGTIFHPLIVIEERCRGSRSQP